MQSEGRNARFLTCSFPQLSSLKLSVKGDREGRMVDQRRAVAVVREMEEVGSEFERLCESVCSEHDFRCSEKGAAMAVTCVQGG